MRVFATWVSVLGLLLGAIGTAHAITLYRSNAIELFTIEVGDSANNAHPVNYIDPKSLAQLLASLQLDSREAGGPVYLMSETQAITAADELTRALARVDEHRDVHLISYRNVGSFPATRRLATGARVFVENDSLNMIFGQVDEFLDEFREPYEKRARPGQRANERLSGGGIRAATWFQFKPGRSDWVVYPIKMQNSPRSTLRLELTPAPEAPTPAKAVPRPIPTPTPTPTPAAPADRWQDLEAGLETLQRLRDKGLITDDEFQTKRRALLDGVGL